MSRIPAAIENDPNVVKKAMKVVPGDVGRVDGVLLRRVDVEAERPQRRPEAVHDLVRQGRAAHRAAAVGDEDVANLPGHAEERLRVGERHEESGVRRARALVPDDVAHGRAGGRAAAEDQDPVAGLHAELVGRVGVQEDLAAPELRERDLSVTPLDRPEPLHARRVGGEERDARLGLALRRRLDGDLLDDRRRDAVDEIGAGQPGVDRVDDRLVEVLDAGRRADAGSELDVGALRRHELVRVPEGGDGRRADGVAHGVAGRERHRHDRRAEHEAEHDQRRSAPAAPHVAHAELHQDGVPQRQEAQNGQRDHQRAHEQDEDRPDRDAEELGHASPTDTPGSSA